MYDIHMIHKWAEHLPVQQSKSAEELEAFGREAAKAYMSGSVSLPDAIVAQVKSAGLNTEQVCRVIEFANHAAYRHQREKLAMAGTPHRVVNFDGMGPASREEVLGMLNKTVPAMSSSADRGLGDYRSSPTEKYAALQLQADLVRQQQEETAQEAVFAKTAKLAQEHGMDLQAFEGYEQYKHPADPLLLLRDKLASRMHEEATLLGRAEREAEILWAGVLKEAHAALSGGAELGTLAHAWAQAVDDPTFLQGAFAKLATDLQQWKGYTPAELVESMSKNASHMYEQVNTEHPLMQRFLGFYQAITKAAQAYAHREEAAYWHDYTVQTLNTMSKQADFKLHMNALKDGLRDAQHAFHVTEGVIPKVHNALGQMANPVGNAARAATGAVIGPGAVADAVGTVARTGTQYAVPIGIGAGAWQLSRRPEAQKATYWMNSRFNPLSNAYAERQYMLDNGMA